MDEGVTESQAYQASLGKLMQEALVIEIRLILTSNKVNIGSSSGESSPAFIKQRLEVNGLGNQRSLTEPVTTFHFAVHSNLIEALSLILCGIFKEATDFQILWCLRSYISIP